jgi:hypothetical protein
LEDFSVGPDLPTLVNDPKVLRVWLKDPTAIKPDAQMPNLALKKTEIEALITFLLAPASEAKEASAPLAEPDGQPVIPALAGVKTMPAKLFFIRAQGATDKQPLALDLPGKNTVSLKLDP